eukprot:3719827-Pyramimonas_sp.AAC.1
MHLIVTGPSSRKCHVLPAAGVRRDGWTIEAPQAEISNVTVPVGALRKPSASRRTLMSSLCAQS